MQIEKIRLGQDSRGYGKGLFVENVRVAPVDSEPVTFPCACWLAEDVWDSKTERDLLPGKAVKRPESMFNCFSSKDYASVNSKSSHSYQPRPPPHLPLMTTGHCTRMF